MNLSDYNKCPTVSAVYAIVHTATNKRYIGSSANVKVRISQHVSRLRYGQHYNKLLQANFERDGIQAFQIEIIEETTADKLKLAEQYAITQLDSTVTGYNRNINGVGAPTIVPGQHTETRCLTISREDLAVLLAINSNLSKAVRIVIDRHRKEHPK